jgi:hypothetical protein
MPGIMVATDGSAGADRAVDAAAKLASATSCELTILTIYGRRARLLTELLTGNPELLSLSGVFISTVDTSIWQASWAGRGSECVASERDHQECGNECDCQDQQVKADATTLCLRSQPSTKSESA